MIPDPDEYDGTNATVIVVVAVGGYGSDRWRCEIPWECYKRAECVAIEKSALWKYVVEERSQIDVPGSDFQVMRSSRSRQPVQLESTYG